MRPTRGAGSPIRHDQTLGRQARHVINDVHSARLDFDTRVGIGAVLQVSVELDIGGSVGLTAIDPSRGES